METRYRYPITPHDPLVSGRKDGLDGMFWGWSCFLSQPHEPLTTQGCRTTTKICSKNPGPEIREPRKRLNRQGHPALL